MIISTKWNTPWQHFSPTVVTEAEVILGACHDAVMKGKWSPGSMAVDERGFITPIGNSNFASKMSLVGLMFNELVTYSLSARSDALFELVFSILGSEANKMGYTSPVRLELEGGKSKVIELLGRSINICRGIAKNREEQDSIEVVADYEHPIAGIKRGDWRQ